MVEQNEPSVHRSDTGRLARHVERASLRVDAMRADLRWESGLSEDGEWLRRIVSRWEPDLARPDNAYAEPDGA